jgi:hypothetical protein
MQLNLAPINRRDAMDAARPSRNRTQKALTAEYAEYAEKELLCRFAFRVFREGMSFVNGAPWNTQDAIAERTEAVSP